MTRFLAIAALLCSSAVASAEAVLVDLVPIETGFTSTLTPNATDIWGVVVTTNDNTDPIFSFDLSIPGNFVQSEGAPTAANRNGSILVAGVLPAADTYFSVPDTIDQSNVAIAPGTATDSTSLLEAAYTITGDIPVLAAGEIDVIIATLAVPAGEMPELPDSLGTAAVRTSAGPVSVDVLAIPEPTTVMLAGLAVVGFLARRK